MYRLTNEVQTSTSGTSELTHSTSYEYDLNGNRVKRTQGTEVITYAYNEDDQLIGETNGTDVTAYQYDANGSLTNKTTPSNTISYAYNLANRLSSVTSEYDTTTYLYNDSGIRVRKAVNGNPTHYLVDANNHTGYAQVLEEFYGTISPTNLTMSYVIGDDVLAQCSTDENDPAYRADNSFEPTVTLCPV